MKEGWQTKTLGDVCHVYQPETISQKQMNGGEFPVYGANGQIGWHNQFNHDEPQLILGCRGSCGSVNFTKSRSWINGNAMVVQPKSEVIDPFYLAYAFKGGIELADAITGTAQPQITRTSLMPLPIMLPESLTEQKRIVALLDESFAGLTTAKANAERNLQSARSLFESHLESVFVRQGPGWIATSIGELVDDGVLAKPFDGNHGEIHPKKSDYTESGVPFVMARDLKDGLVDTRQCAYISRSQAESLRIGFAQDGDVLISHKGTIGRTAILRTAEDFVMLTPQVTAYRVTDNKRLDNRFARYYFMSPGFQREMAIGAADGSTRAYIGITKQLSLPFSFPALADQQRIAHRLGHLYKETQHLTSIYERKLAALEELRKSLLQQAFNGEL